MVEAMRCVLLCMLDAGGYAPCDARIAEVEVMRCVLRCMLEAVEGVFCLLEDVGGGGGGGGDALRAALYAVWYAPCDARIAEVVEVMRCVLLCMLEAVEGVLCLLEDVGGGGGDALRAALYAGGCGRCALFAGGCWTCLVERGGGGEVCSRCRR